MWKILALVIAAAASVSYAKAAPISYKMKFLDAAGETVGRGLLSFDREVTEEIWLFEETGARCDPLAPVSGATCEYRETWTPLKLTAEILGVPFSLRFSFLEGSIILPGRCQCGRLQSGDWVDIDDIDGTGLFIVAGNLDAALAWSASALEFLPILDDTFAVGTVFLERQEIPLPAAAWLFATGAAGLSLCRRSKSRLALLVGSRKARKV